MYQIRSSRLSPLDGGTVEEGRPHGRDSEADRANGRERAARLADGPPCGGDVRGGSSQGRRRRMTGGSLDFANLVAGVLEVDAAEVSDVAGAEALPTWTSLRHLQLVVTLEEAYGISFTYQEIRGLDSIGAVRQALLAKGIVTAGPTAERDGQPVAG